MEKRLYRSRKNKVLSGILGGIGEYYAADPLGYRILFYFLGSPNFEIHCFTGDAPTAMEFVKRGGLVALNGIITFDKTGRSDKVVKNLPLESTIFETDAPFLTPLPHRGKRNEPSYVRFVAEKLAQMKGIDISKVEEVTTANARRLFRI